MSQDNREKTVYFVRHGESEDNVAPVFQSLGSPLSTAGKMQAEKIADRASRLSFETLISSPLQRAKETAEAISHTTGKAIEFSELFVERIKPSYTYGKSYKDEKANQLWLEWEKSLYTPGLKVEDGENFDDLVTRVDNALNFLTERPEASLLVVTHGYFLRTIVARALLGNLLTGEIFKKFQSSVGMENTGLTVLRYKKSYEGELEWRLWIYNDHAHLA